MTKLEIKSKLDEIIAFSGVEKHIDTPVKRYSSGMYVRLAFAVAAHLEPEILIVDEVLAVGDAEFQKKCLGKMNTVAKEGRTVLFVSHNMGAIQNLCNKGILLNQGKVFFEGSAEETISKYGNLSFNNSNAETTWDNLEKAPGNKDVRIVAVRVLDKNFSISNVIADNQEFFVEIQFVNYKEGSYLTSNIQLLNKAGVWVLSTGNWASVTANIDPFSSVRFKKGMYKSRVKIPAFFLNEGDYSVNALLNEDASNYIAYAEEAVSFTIMDSGAMKREYTDFLAGVVRPRLEWNTESLG
jgi:lipopolysaccharide transport system ATP-binding protein